MFVELLSDLVVILLFASFLGSVLVCFELVFVHFFRVFLLCSCSCIILHLVSCCVATDIYLCFQHSTACPTSSQASSAVETRAVTAETKAAAAAAIGATTTLTELRDLAASKLGVFQRRFVNPESTAWVCHDFITRKQYLAWQPPPPSETSGMLSPYCITTKAGIRQTDSRRKRSGRIRGDQIACL